MNDVCSTQTESEGCRWAVGKRADKTCSQHDFQINMGGERRGRQSPGSARTLFEVSQLYGSSQRRLTMRDTERHRAKGGRNVRESERKNIKRVCQVC